VARLFLRLLGLSLLTFSIGVSSCQALFPHTAEQQTPQLQPASGEGRSR
jgi:hypothetical protein